MSEQDIAKIQVQLKVIDQTSCPGLSDVTKKVKAGHKVGTLVNTLAKAAKDKRLAFSDLNNDAYLDVKKIMLESSGQMVVDTEYVTGRR